MLIARCHDCRKYHLIKDPWGTDEMMDWQVKHPGHHIEFVDPRPLDPRFLEMHGYKPNADIKLAYAASAAMTITLASLATDANLLTGRNATVVDNTSNLYLNYMVAGKITTGTTPTDLKRIEVWAYGQLEDTPTYPDSFTGVDAAKTVTSANIKAAILYPVASLATGTTSDRTYWFGPRSLVSVFGGIIPKRWGIFVTHDTAVNLNATAGNHAIWQTGTYLTA